MLVGEEDMAGLSVGFPFCCRTQRNMSSEYSLLMAFGNHTVFVDLRCQARGMRTRGVAWPSDGILGGDGINADIKKPACGRRFFSVYTKFY